MKREISSDTGVQGTITEAATPEHEAKDFKFTTEHWTDMSIFMWRIQDAIQNEYVRDPEGLHFCLLLEYKAELDGEEPIWGTVSLRTTLALAKLREIAASLDGCFDPDIIEGTIAPIAEWEDLDRRYCEAGAVVLRPPNYVATVRFCVEPLQLQILRVQGFEDVVNRAVIQVAVMLSQKLHVAQKLVAVNLV
jgi:hypothetical protein